MLLVHLSLLHALFELLLGLFVLFLGLLFGLLHILQRELFLLLGLLLGLVVVVIGCQASPAAQVRRGLRQLRTEGAASRGGKGHVRQAD